MNLLPRRLIFIGMLALAFASIVATGRVQANQTPPVITIHTAVLTSDTVNTVRGAAPTTTSPPLAEQNPCLHCHVIGQIENEWSPISRWLVFGTMVFAFVFGLNRNVVVWRTRDRWQHDWMERFSILTAIPFTLQVLTGLVLFIFSQATLEIIVQIMAVIQFIHWGSGIALFIAALGLSFAGMSLPGFQRPFWAMIFITGIIGGALGLANLSFAFLYAEWHDPPLQGRLYAFHIMLIPIALAGITSIYRIIQRKRGATQ
jgi:hypothetical protein